MDNVVCDQCNKEFPSKQSLVLHVGHMHSAPNPPLYRCDVCSMQLRWKQTLVDHIRAGTGHQRIIYTCNQCKIEFPTRRGLDVHIRDNKSCPGHICDLCSKQYRSRQTLGDHLRDSSQHDCTDSVNNEGVICDGCDRQFPKQGLIIHFLRWSCPTPRSYKCDLCLKHFNQRQPLIFHLQAGSRDLCPNLSTVRAQPSTAAKYQCDQCRNRFVSKDGLVIHISTFHQPRKVFPCVVCGAQFGHAAYLRIHVANMHGKQKPQCDECNVKFNQKTHLTTHIKSMHLGLRPFKCKQCQSSFTQSSHLNTHISLVHTQSVMQCDNCGAKLNGRSSLEYHILGVHMKLKQFKCDMCPAAYSYKSQLRGHKRAVHKTGFVVCDLCEQKAERKQILEHHCMAVHLGLRPYKCSVCAKAFASNAELELHKNRISVHV